MEFFRRTGPMALGSRLRLLADRITEDAGAIYAAYGTELQPKWFPVFYVLSAGAGASVTEIADAIGHSHASVSKILKEMTAARLTAEKADPADGRRTVVSLSRRGRDVARKIEVQYADVRAAVEGASAEATHDLWAALEEWEQLLARRSLLERVLATKAERESSRVEVVDYQPQHEAAFRELNLDWITTHFKVEPSDRKALDDPKGYILDRGGFILVATVGGKAAGGARSSRWRRGSSSWPRWRSPGRPAATASGGCSGRRP